MRIFENSKDITRYLYFLVFAFIVFFSIPKEGKFKYEFNKNDYWKHEDLIAPFSYGVKKSEQEIEDEKAAIKESFKPYFRIKPGVSTQVLKSIDREAEKLLLTSSAGKSPVPVKELKNRIVSLVRGIYAAGLVDWPETFSSGIEPETIIILDENQAATEKNTTHLIKSAELPGKVQLLIEQDSLLTDRVDITTLISLLESNLYYDRELSGARMKSLLEGISGTIAVVDEGDKIISKGVRINGEKYRALESLRNEYENRFQSDNHYNYAGYFLLVIMLILGFGIYIFQFYPKIFYSTTRLLMVLVTTLLFIVLSAYISRATSFNLYVVPFCIVPIIILSFFESRIAFISHLFTILVVSTFAPNNFEFLFIQTLAGLAVILGISRVKFLSQFFIAVLLVSFVYYFGYLALQLNHTISLREINYLDLLWFSGCFLLTLLAYPLIYAYEKIFGLLSDITLIELSDINKKLLRDLSMKAPGTFQHSIQVGNLSEVVLNNIGGNALLARVSCLYHDIGKMYAPELFTENQNGYSPHGDLDEMESAKRIIRHIPEGVKMAKAANLPQEVIDFITMHQGTTRTEYFYRTYINNHPEEKIDDSVFRYPGPRPKTKETAVVMIADSVEAAARSLKQPNPENIGLLVDNLVDAKMKDNQFDEADISIKDILKTKEILVKTLLTMHHSRIEYHKEKKI